MNPATQTLLISIAGLLSTSLAGGAGLYFVARGRNASLRQHLYQEQLRLVVRIIRIIGKIRTYAPMVLDSSGPHHERALDDLGVKLRQLSETTDAAAALLPTELYVEVSRLTRVVTDFLVDHDEARDVSWFPAKLAGHSAKTALLARALLGVDELSTESAALFTRKATLANVANLEPDAIAAKAKADIEKRPSNDR